VTVTVLRVPAVGRRLERLAMPTIYRLRFLLMSLGGPLRNTRIFFNLME